jgi:hypothetical protein
MYNKDFTYQTTRPFPAACVESRSGPCRIEILFECRRRHPSIFATVSCSVAPENQSNRKKSVSLDHSYSSLYSNIKNIKIYVRINSKIYGPVFSYCCRCWKLHNEYHQHVSSRLHVPAISCIPALLENPRGKFWNSRWLGRRNFLVARTRGASGPTSIPTTDCRPGEGLGNNGFAVLGWTHCWLKNGDNSDNNDNSDNSDNSDNNSDNSE